MPKKHHPSEGFRPIEGSVGHPAALSVPSENGVQPRLGTFTHRFAPFLALLLMPLVLISPLALPGLPATSDGLYHLYRASELAACLSEGTWYPRWAPDFAQGLGYPIFNFYAPFADYLQVGLRAFGLDAIDSLKAALALVVVAAGFGMYLLARNLFGRNGGLLAATAYAYSPVVYLNAHARADLPELTAIALLPFVLWAFRGLAMTPGAGRLAGAGAAYALLVLSHNLTAFYFSPALVAYAVVLVLPRRDWQAALRVGAALALGLALSAFFWLPALGERDWVQIKRLLPPSGVDYRDYFLPITQLVMPQLPIDIREYGAAPDHRLGGMQVVLGLAGLAALVARRTPRETRWELAFFGFLATAFAFLCTASSGFIWQVLPFGGLVQFPWRFLDGAGLGLAVLAGSAVHWLPGPGVVKGSRGRLVAPVALGAAALALVLSIGPYLYAAYPATREQGAGDGSVAAALDYERWSGTLGTSWKAEFLPIWTQWVPKDAPKPVTGRPAERLDRGTLPPGINLSAMLVAQRGDYESYRTSSPDEATLLFRLIYYPAWHAYADGKELPVTPFTQYELGWVTFKVPPGDHLVEVRFEPTPLATAGDLVSITAGFILFILVLVGVSHVLRGRPAAEPVAAKNPGPLGAWVLAGVAAALLVGQMAYADGHPDLFRYASAAGTAPPAQHRLAVDFEGKLLALGYDLAPVPARAGETARVDIYWELATSPTTDYSAKVLLVKNTGDPPLAEGKGLRYDEALRASGRPTCSTPSRFSSNCPPTCLPVTTRSC